MFRDLPRYDTYAQSSVAWSPPLPEHWRVERGKTLFRRVQREPRETDGVVTCFRDGVVTLRSRRRATGFTESLKEIGYQGIRVGDLVIHAMDAFAGAVGVSDSDGKGTPVYSVCVPKSDANPHYFAAVVREMARTSWIQALAKGVRERSTDFRFEAFGSQFLPLPPPEEQAAIVKYLAHANARIDKAITAKRHLIALLDELQEIRLASITRVSWNATDQASVAQTSRLVQTGPFGSQVHADEYVNGGVPLINPAHLSNGGIQHDAAVSVSEQKSHELARHRLQTGDVVVARRGDLGRCSVVTEAEAGWLCGTGCLIVRLRSDCWIPAYFQLVFASTANRQRLDAGSIGSTMSNLNASQVGRLRFSCPSIPEQRNKVAEATELRQAHLRRVSLVEREIALLQEFRARLVADVVTGQVDVRAVAATLPDAPEAVVDLAAGFVGQLDEDLAAAVESGDE